MGQSNTSCRGTGSVRRADWLARLLWTCAIACCGLTVLAADSRTLPLLGDQAGVRHFFGRKYSIVTPARIAVRENPPEDATVVVAEGAGFRLIIEIGLSDDSSDTVSGLVGGERRAFAVDGLHGWLSRWRRSDPAAARRRYNLSLVLKLSRDLRMAARAECVSLSSCDEVESILRTFSATVVP